MNANLKQHWSWINLGVSPSVGSSPYFLFHLTKSSLLKRICFTFMSVLCVLACVTWPVYVEFRGHLQMSVLAFYHLGPGKGTLVFRSDSKCLYLLSHLTKHSPLCLGGSFLLLARQELGEQRHSQHNLSKHPNFARLLVHNSNTVCRIPAPFCCLPGLGILLPSQKITTSISFHHDQCLPSVTWTS